MVNEKRLIDAEALCDLITATFPPMSYNAMYMAIENAPTVDAVEVVHGRWNRRKSCHSQTGFVDQCSVCQFALVHLGQKTNYCPNCGADMRGEGSG